MKYIVFDLEMTSWKSKIRSEPNGCMYIYDKGEKVYLKVNYHEIIEIGAYKLNNEYQIIDKFQCYVKPINSLTSHCKKFTGISEDNLKDAVKFNHAMNKFIDWINFNNNTKIYTWSKNDKRQIVNEAEKRAYDNNKINLLFSKYFDLQKQFSKEYNKRIHAGDKGYVYGLEQVLKMLNITVSKNKELHSAIVDAEYTAKILQILGKYNLKVEINLIAK
ncbi:MAG: exonuclease domain-containing protein [archaeon]